MHYKNGREAHVGDPVVGITYNLNEKVIAGTLVAITPGEDACSAEVAYLETLPVGDVPRYPSFVGGMTHGDSQHGNDGRMMITHFRTDATHCANLLHAEDAFTAGQE